MDNKYSFGFIFEFKNKATRSTKKAKESVDALATSIEALQTISKREISTEETDKYANALAKIIPKQRAANGAAGEGSRKLTGLQKSLRVLSKAWRANRYGIRLFHAALLAVTASKALSVIRRGVSGLGRMMVGVVKTGKDFDQTLTATASNMKLNAKGAEQLRAFVKRTGATTNKTANEVGQGMLSLSQSGYGLIDSMRLTTPAIKLAGATLTKYGRTMEILKDTMRVFGIGTQDTVKTTDTLTAATLSSSTNLSQLGLGLKQVSGIASASGRSLFETVSVLSVFANAGRRGADGGVAFRNVLATLQTPSKNLRSTLKFLGLDMKDLSPKTNNFVTIFSRLRPLMKRTDLVWKLFGKRTAPAFLAFMRQGPGAIAKMQAAMSKASKTAKVYDKNMNTVAGRIQIFQSAVEGLKIELFDLIKKQFKADLKDATVLINRISTAVKRAGPVIVKVFRSGGEIVRFAARQIFGATRSILKGFDLLTKTGKVSNKSLRDVIAPMVVAVELAKNRVLDFVTGMIKGFKVGFTGAKTYLLLILTPLYKATAAVLEWAGVIKKGDNALMKFGKVMGVVLGAFTVFAAAKLALLIPSFVLSSIVSAGRALWAIGYVLFAQVVPGIISFTRVLLTQHLPALISWASRVSLMSGISLVSLKASMLGALVATKGLTLALLAQAAAWAATPIGQAVIAVVAIGVATYFLIRYWKEWTTWIRKGGAWMEGLVAGITAFFPILGTTLNLVRHWESLGGAIKYVMGLLRKIPGMSKFLGKADDFKKGGKRTVDVKKVQTQIFDFNKLPVMKKAAAVAATVTGTGSTAKSKSNQNAVQTGSVFGTPQQGQPFAIPGMNLPNLSKLFPTGSVPQMATQSPINATINIYTQAGQNPKEIAEMVKKELDRLTNRGRG